MQCQNPGCHVIASCTRRVALQFWCLRTSALRTHAPGRVQHVRVCLKSCNIDLVNVYQKVAASSLQPSEEGQAPCVTAKSLRKDVWTALLGSSGHCLPGTFLLWQGTSKPLSLLRQLVLGPGRVSSKVLCLPMQMNWRISLQTAALFNCVAGKERSCLIPSKFIPIRSSTSNCTPQARSALR